MIVPDVNLLLYATITGFAHHQRARAWWEDTINNSVPVGLTAPAAFGFLRPVDERSDLRSADGGGRGGRPGS